jgi:hypothetical protein
MHDLAHLECLLDPRDYAAYGGRLQAPAQHDGISFKPLSAITHKHTFAFSYYQNLSYA